MEFRNTVQSYLETFIDDIAKINFNAKYRIGMTEEHPVLRKVFQAE